METRKASIDTCVKKYCKGPFTKSQYDGLQRVNKKFGLKMKTHTLKQMRANKKDIDACKKGYCNPECKGTIFQNGKNFPANIDLNIKNAKSRKIAMNLTRLFRARMFKSKSSVLKGDFFNKLKSSNVSRLKKQGALSGCSLMLVS